MKTSVKSKEPESPPSKKNEIYDDAISFVELAAEEVTGIGVGKRVYNKIKIKISKEYIERIVKLEEMLDASIRGLDKITDYCDAIQTENVNLKNEIQRLKRLNTRKNVKKQQD